jgi:hypothetical protein
MKVILIIIFSFFFNTFFSQNYLNYKLKNLSNIDSIYIDSFTFYKVSNLNINNFLKDTNSVIIKYSTWCRAIDKRNIYINYLLLKNKDLKIYLITSDLNTSVKENIEYLKNNSLSNKILYLDYNIYKKGNWSVKYANFINSICPNCVTFGINTTNFLFYRSNNNYQYKERY